MNLRTFLNSMKPAEQAEFARRCDTSIAYLRKAISSRQPLRVALCVDIERESGRLVTRHVNRHPIVSTNRHPKVSTRSDGFRLISPLFEPERIVTRFQNFTVMGQPV